MSPTGHYATLKFSARSLLVIALTPCLLTSILHSVLRKQTYLSCIVCLRKKVIPKIHKKQTIVLVSVTICILHTPIIEITAHMKKAFISKTACGSTPITNKISTISWFVLYVRLQMMVHMVGRTKYRLLFNQKNWEIQVIPPFQTKGVDDILNTHGQFPNKALNKKQNSEIKSFLANSINGYRV